MFVRLEDRWQILDLIFWVLNILKWVRWALTILWLSAGLSVHLYSLSCFKYVTFSPTPLPCLRKLENNICHVIYAYRMLASDFSRICVWRTSARSRLYVCTSMMRDSHSIRAYECILRKTSYSSLIACENMTWWNIARHIPFNAKKRVFHFT